MKYTVEKNNNFIVVYRNVGIVCYVCLLLAFTITVVLFSANIYIYILYVVFLTIVFLCNLFLNKIAFKILLDTENKKIIFYMIKNKKIYEYGLSDVKFISINGHMSFVFEDKVIYWHSPNFLNENELLFIENISKFANVKWGWICAVDSNVLSFKNKIEKCQ